MAEKEINPEIEKALEQVYEKHLPKSQAEWLKKRLELVEDLENRLERGEELVEKLSEEYKKLEKAKNKLEAEAKSVDEKAKQNLQLSQELSKREEKVSERENKAKITELETKLEASEKISYAHHEFLRTLTKAPVVRKTLHENVSKQFQNQQTETGYADKESGHVKTTDIDEDVVE